MRSESLKRLVFCRFGEPLLVEITFRCEFRYAYEISLLDKRGLYESTLIKGFSLSARVHSFNLPIAIDNLPGRYLAWTFLRTPDVRQHTSAMTISMNFKQGGVVLPGCPINYSECDPNAGAIVDFARLEWKLESSTAGKFVQ